MCSSDPDRQAVPVRPMQVERNEAGSGRTLMVGGHPVQVPPSVPSRIPDQIAKAMTSRVRPSDFAGCDDSEGGTVTALGNEPARSNLNLDFRYERIFEQLTNSSHKF